MLRGQERTDGSELGEAGKSCAFELLALHYHLSLVRNDVKCSDGKRLGVRGLDIQGLNVHGPGNLSPVKPLLNR